MVGDKGAEAGAEHLPPPIELFYDNVLEKKGEAAFVEGPESVQQLERVWTLPEKGRGC